MTPRRYFTFACLTALIQGGVIASQSQPANIPLPAGTVMGSIQSINLAISTHAAPSQTTSPVTPKPVQEKKPLTSSKQLKNKPTHPVISKALDSVKSPTPKAEPKLNPLTQTKPQKQTDITTAMALTSKNKSDNQVSTKKLTAEPKPLQVKAKAKPESESEVNASSQLESQANQGATLQSMALSRPTFTAPPSQPNYPKLARKRGFEGTAMVEVMFNQIGEQLSLTLINSSGFTLLDKAALKAVKKWQFSAPSPQTAYAYTVRVPVRFALN